MTLVPQRVPATLVAAAIAVLAFAPSAGAFSVTGVTVTPRAPAGLEPSGPLPADPASAGAHPVLDITTSFDNGGGPPGDTAKNLTQHLGPGIVANPNATPKCTQADFNVASPAAAGCAANTQIGTTAVTTIVGLTGIIYNLAPNAGQPAALGVDVNLVPLLPAHEKFIVPVTVDPHDLGLNTTLTGLSPTLPITSIKLTLFGYASTGIPFFTNPTACTPSSVSVTATAQSNATSSNSGSYTPTDCATAPFDTALTFAADPTTTDSPSAITVDVKPAPVFVPRVNSYVKSTTVVLPDGVLLNPALAANLDACTDAQFAQSDSSVAATCPASSEVGDITFVSPILGAFPGKAYFGTGTPSDKLRLFLDVPLFGAHIKISGHVRPDPRTGQVTTVFDELPQIAFLDFALAFKGGARSALTTPATCGVHTGTATVLPYSGGPASTPSGTLTSSFDGQGSACPFLFHPTMSTAVSTTKAGASPTFTLVFGRPDRNSRIQKLKFRLPTGLVGNLALKGLTRCTLSDAAAQRCAASSRLGPVAAVIGSGSEPPTLPGNVYLTQPKVAGDPAGLSIQVPAKLGPVDAGTVIVGARLQLRSDGGLNVTSDPIPALQEGIPVALRRLAVTIDRAGFMRNPTSCGTKTPKGHFDALGGGSADASASLTIADCGKLPFAPTIAATLGSKGATRVNTHPPLTTTVTQRGGEAAIRRVHVALPSALSTNITAINAACAPDVLAAGKCSSRARIGSAKAVSPLVSKPLSGPVYLVTQKPGTLPKLVVQLRGPLTIQFEGFVNVGKHGRIGTTFPKVPDIPLKRFVLTFHSGKYGVLTAIKSLCSPKLRFPAGFTGQNGTQVKRRPLIDVKGCPAPSRRGHR